MLAAIKDSGLEWIQILLTRWGDCMAGNPYRGLWYPSTNIIERMRSVAGGGKMPEWTQDVDRIESALTVLGLENAKALQIIKAFYIFGQSDTQLAAHYRVDWRTAKKWRTDAEGRTATIYEDIAKS